MGTIRNGANGGFSGKAGSVIGSSWNDISYIKGLPKLSNKPASLKQLDQRARFAAVLQYLAPIKDMLILGFKGQNAGRATGFNMGIQHAIINAVTGTYPDYQVDKALVQISRGTLQKPGSVVVASTVAGALELSWLPQVNNLNAFASDTLVALLYNEEQSLFLSYTDVATRQAGTATIAIPTDFSGQTVHAYFFYIKEDGSRQSISIYQGPTTII
ncbi:MAG: hypothetical protein EOP54_20510 [Sphingobacteriales bacterium]|nr:MAG: hypothetical protein EOP54_20510 [Sphingobacteriales bacterium]